jgi:hypothetical protein
MRRMYTCTPLPRAYMHDLLRAAATMLAERWSSGTLAPLHMCASMALVALPGACQRNEANTCLSAATLGKLQREVCVCACVCVCVCACVCICVCVCVCVLTCIHADATQSKSASLHVSRVGQNHIHMYIYTIIK